MTPHVARQLREAEGLRAAHDARRARFQGPMDPTARAARIVYAVHRVTAGAGNERHHHIAEWMAVAASRRDATRFNEFA